MKRLFCLILAALASLSAGCGILRGSYVSVKPHQVGYAQENQDESVIRTYSELRNSVTGLIDNRQETGVFTLTDYPEEDVHRDMERAITYACTVYPIGVYAVSDITYEYGQNRLSVSIDFRRSEAELDQIRTVRGVEGAKAAVNQALAGFEDVLVLQITGYSETDFSQYVADYAAEHPEIVMELPQVTVQVTPQQGLARIVELQFTYQTTRDSRRSMLSQVRQVFSSAQLYVSSDAADAVKLNQLYGFLAERFDYTIQTSITPSYSLLCYGIGDSRAFAQVYAAMCRQSGLEAMTVSGTRNGESRFWNIVRDGDTYYHVDLLECAARGYFREMSDGEMGAYVWDYSAYPACGTPVSGETQPPETQPEESAPEETVAEETIPEETEPEETQPEETVPEETVPEETGETVPPTDFVE